MKKRMRILSKATIILHYEFCISFYNSEFRIPNFIPPHQSPSVTASPPRGSLLVGFFHTISFHQRDGEAIHLMRSRRRNKNSFEKNAAFPANKQDSGQVGK